MTSELQNWEDFPEALADEPSEGAVPSAPYKIDWDNFPVAKVQGNSEN